MLLTRSPLIRPASWPSPFDLHVLSTPPAFVLSQNQTLRKCLHGTPPPKSSEATDTRNGPDKDRSDSAEFWHRTPTEVEDNGTYLNQDPPPSTPPPQTGQDIHQIASHMASTIWHTVEFSRNRRASPRDLSISSERLCRSESYLAFGPLPATRSGSMLRAVEPVPDPASGRTKRLSTRSGVATLGTSHRGSIRGVRSSLSGDIENITRVLRQVANPVAVTPVTRRRPAADVQVRHETADGPSP